MVVSMCEVNLATVMFPCVIGYHIQAQTVIYGVPQLKLFLHLVFAEGDFNSAIH